ncbi:MAG: hypothetical protein KDC34_07775 [Saprospiraceae bacterium]|nr:hypothetical protein [Saprospiraceae bacterium]
MKRILIFIAAFILLNLAWMGFVRDPLPAIPSICAEISDEVRFDFSINTMDYSGLEFSLKDKVDGKGMFIEFKMNNAWETGRPGLVVNQINTASNFEKRMSPEKYLEDQKRPKKGGRDFSNFMKDNSGRSVSTFTFKQRLVEDENGKLFMRMSYEGSAMEMIQTLEIPRAITIPTHISRRFNSTGTLQFQPGVVAYDSKIKGFYIPVLVN